jgi:uncharacterized membrane protein HdeD (DUF308 family)
MKPLAIAGVLLVVLGLAALAYQGVSYTSRETIIDIGPVRATADRERTLPLPPVVGILAVAGGVALLVASARKRA